MRGILYVSHGSRIYEARKEAESFIHSVRAQIDVELQEICFLELAKPDLQQGVKTLVDQGATEISVIPVLLLSAGHYFRDIPEEMNTINEKYPHIKFLYGKPLGVQSRLTNILKERIQETGIRANKDAKILVVGRGSYNPQTEIDISSIGRELKESTGFDYVDVCYLAACRPSFEDALQQSLEAEHSQVFIVPYLWFTGVLEKYIEEKIQNHSTNKQVVLCHHLGNHPAMQEALKERVYETFKYPLQLYIS
ncbi:MULTISPECIES: sirohydrochlorin chelatase [Salinicoccus]|uniref:sirohydrochlorin chelatase n=1 Tax=Salinicoccus TaxID=45669 RepID=UPI0004E148EF|nr:sirohydrochlorin chelatase [Salinicoccus luteus]